MGIFKKIKGIMDPYDVDSQPQDTQGGMYDDDDGYYDEPAADYSQPMGQGYQQQYPYQPQPQQQSFSQHAQPSYQQPQPQPQRSQAVTAQNGSPLSLKVVKPEKFEDSYVVADHLINHNTVVLNLEETNKEICRRILDILSGVIYTINGSIKKVSNLTYVLTPANVDISSDQVNENARNNY